MKNRCSWAGDNPLNIEYHDKEWGVSVHEDRLLFEFLILEGHQAGLSWLTILKKRENYLKAFDYFNPAKVARYDQVRIDRLLLNDGVIRNRLKIHAAVQNAKVFLEVKREFGSFDKYIWGFVDGKPIVNRWKNLKEIPAKTPLSDKMSKDLLKRGFKFVGSTICYAFMQAVGMVNDHTVDCFRYKEIIPQQTSVKLHP
jgi:DNA-3-methyladenine glycosylase I